MQRFSLFTKKIPWIKTLINLTRLLQEYWSTHNRIFIERGGCSKWTNPHTQKNQQPTKRNSRRPPIHVQRTWSQKWNRSKEGPSYMCMYKNNYNSKTPSSPNHMGGIQVRSSPTLAPFLFIKTLRILGSFCSNPSPYL